MAMDEKYLFYDSQAADSVEQKSLIEGNATWLWNDRLLLVEHISYRKRWRFTALDLITNETRPVYLPKSQSNAWWVKIVSLNKDYGFVVESADDSFCVNLVKLMWAPGEFQLVERFEQAGRFSDILVNSLNPTKFVLQYFTDDYEYIHKACTLDSGKVEVVGTYDIGFYKHYFNDTLFDFDDDEITIYNLTTAEEKSFEIEDINDGEIDNGCVEWVKERLYAAVRFDDTETYGIGYTDLKTLNWNFLDLRTDLRIRKMQFFNGNLIVYAAENTTGNNIFDEDFLFDSVYFSKFKIYSIPIRHPQSLRKMAWPLVVQAFKRDESISDPYKAAAQFLPFNCDLRPPWYKDETALENLDEPESNEQGNPGWMQVFKAMLSQLKQLLAKQAKEN